jgi:hypothetical protein
MSPAAKQAPATMYSQYARVNPFARAVDGPPSSNREGTGNVARATVRELSARSDEMSSSRYPVRKSAFR